VTKFSNKYFYFQQQYGAYVIANINTIGLCTAGIALAQHSHEIGHDLAS